MNARDLITLQNVKDWLNASGTFPTSSDPILSRLVTGVSLFAGSYLQRQLQPAAYSETYSGFDTKSLTLRNNPVISVSALSVGTTVITARTAVGSYGYVADATTLYIDGCGLAFCRGIHNVAVTYRAGYQTTDTVTVPASPYTVSVTALSHAWNSDQGVAYTSTGVALTPVAVTPTVTGTYQVKADPTGTAEYLFASGDLGASLVITYGFTPEDVVQALVEMAGEAFKRRERIGESSRGLAQQPSAFSQRDMNETIRTLLNPYRQVVPIQ